MGLTAHQPPALTNGEESIGKNNQEENQHKDVQEQRNPSAGPPKQKKGFRRHKRRQRGELKLLLRDA